MAQFILINPVTVGKIQRQKCVTQSEKCSRYLGFVPAPCHGRKSPQFALYCNKTTDVRTQPMYGHYGDLFLAPSAGCILLVSFMVDG